MADNPPENTGPSWPAATARALDRVVRAGGVAMLLGDTDTGKSTLARELVNRGLAAGRRVGVVDADIGQSEIGPPTAIGFGVAAAPVDTLADITAQRLYFVGDTTPARHLLPAVLGTSLLAAAARAAGCDLIVVDTTGMVSGRLAQVLKFHKIQAVRPRTLLAVQDRQELEPVLAPFAGPGGPRIVRLPVAAGVRNKSPAYRQQRRQRALAAYFACAGPLVLDRSVAALWPPQGLSDLADRTCGLLDGLGRTLAVGIFQDADSYSLTVLTPLPAAEGVAAVQVGDLRVSPAGEELGR